MTNALTANPDHFDVLIVGAGLSGIGAAWYVQHKLPGKSYAIVEARDSMGGTWDLFRYPGIRSDSDMHTLGYAFRPWRDEKSLADGPAILQYVRDTARESGIDDHIRYGRRVRRAEWSSAESRWTVEIDRKDGRSETLTCSFLLGSTGYYRYDEGYTPAFPGTERFKGEIVHPQHWPEDLDYAGKRVVVIGSGATAVTLVPSMAPTAAHVTMLQRSPTYILSLPAQDPIANALRKVLPAKAAYALTRAKNVVTMTAFYQLSRRRPEMIKRVLRRGVERALPADYPLDTHFKPRYNPWDQRVCFVPDGDLFRAIRRDQVEIVTDEIEAFTETGIKLRSGAELEADIIVTATGLNLLALGGIELAVDGDDVDVSTTMTYKGMMLSDVPNFAYAVGYTNASWTLKVDLVWEYACRLMRHMDEHGYSKCVAPRDETVGEEPLIDFASGYVQRSINDFPTQGSRAPWRLRMNYIRDFVALRRGEIVDGTMEFSRPEVPAAERELAAA